MRRERHGLGDQDRDVDGGRSQADDPIWVEGTNPERRFPRGTRQTTRLAHESLADPGDDLDIGAIGHPVIVIAGDRTIDDINELASLLLGYTHDEIVHAPIDRLVASLPLPCPYLRSFAARARHRNGRELEVNVLLCAHPCGASIAFLTPLESRRDSEIVQIVHDLKNPLATIALEMCLLEDKLTQPDLKPAVTRVTQNVAFLDRMVQDLLDASAIDADRFTIQRRPTELRELVENVVDRTTATRDRPRVWIEAPLPIVLQLDALRIERVLANLLQNALKYSASSTGVVIRLEVLTNIARVSIIDCGPGITPEERSFIFDKYRRAENAAMHEGSGLGLYVSKRIVEAHGGCIGVESVRGVGSRFYFELPRG